MRTTKLLAASAVLASLLVVHTGRADTHYTTLTDVRLTMSDGVTLAADVYVPTVADQDGDGLYPCVIELTPYRKEARYSEGASYLPAAGIALIEVDARGTGGSEGEYDIVFSVREQADVVGWIEWAATSATKDGEPLGSTNKLCESTVGMYGGSYSGIIQYLVASLPPEAQGSVPAASPYLAAIAPQRAYGDLYRDIVYHGGMVIGSFGLIWSTGTSAYYLQPPTDVETPAGQAAYLDHLGNNDPMMVPYLQNQYDDATFTADDSPPPGWSQRLYADSSVLSRIEHLRVPTLHLAGWFDSFTRGQLRTFQEAHALERALGDRGPNFLIVGPWNHTGTHFIRPDWGFKERLGEWYRYWLEGRAAGMPAPAWITDGPRVEYFDTATGTINGQSATDGVWRTANEWPPPGLAAERLYLDAGGSLRAGAPEAASSASYVYNPGTGYAETLSRWDNAAGTPHPQHDQRLEDASGLTYLTPPLQSAVRLTGPIALHLTASTVGAPGDPSLASSWPASAQSSPPYHDTDWVVKLSDVAPDGSARLLTQGYLRASHRAVDPAKSQYLDGEVIAPYHPHTLAALDPPAPGTPLEYAIEIWPVAKTFRAGHRLRIDIYSADTPNHVGLVKPAVNTVFHGGARPSYLVVPVAEGSFAQP